MALGRRWEPFRGGHRISRHRQNRRRRGLGGLIRAGNFCAWGSSGRARARISMTAIARSAWTSWRVCGRSPACRFTAFKKGRPRTGCRGTPRAGQSIDWTAELDDFADTAALVANLDWSSRWTPPWRILPGRWESRCGCCCRRRRIGDGCSNGRTARGIRRCSCFAGSPRRTGGRSSTDVAKELAKLELVSGDPGRMIRRHGDAVHRKGSARPPTTWLAAFGEFCEFVGRTVFWLFVGGARWKNLRLLSAANV